MASASASRALLLLLVSGCRIGLDKDSLDFGPDRVDDTDVDGTVNTGATGDVRRTFEVSSILFQANFAIDGEGQVAAYKVDGANGVSDNPPFIRVLLVDRAGTEACALEYVTKGFGADGVDTGEVARDAAFDDWRYDNTLIHGFLVKQGNFEGFGPYNISSGQPCTLDEDVFSADPIAGFLAFSGNAGQFRVGIGGALDDDGNTVVSNYAGQNNYPPAANWFGGRFQTPFRYGTEGGGSTDQSSAAVYGRVLGEDMTVSDAAAVLDPGTFPQGGPLPRGIYTIVPAVGLTLNP
ncbi:MAG: hypothetical protein H6732_18405 [Alphaproteobacteria bacterium]|nr:hypothetical protein [Alphaproteobacteria bacterium]